MSAKKKVSAFSTTGKTKKSSFNEIRAPKNLEGVIDDYNKINKEIKSLSAELDQCKGHISSYSLSVYAEKAFSGQTSNIKVKANESAVSFIVMDKSAYLKDEDCENIKEKWGASVAENCIELDLQNLKFDPEVYAQNEELILKTLDQLATKIGMPLFKTQHKAVKNIVNIAVNEVESCEDLEQLLKDLKVTTQIRSAK